MSKHDKKAHHEPKPQLTVTVGPVDTSHRPKKAENLTDDKIALHNPLSLEAAEAGVLGRGMPEGARSYQPCKLEWRGDELHEGVYTETAATGSVILERIEAPDADAVLLSVSVDGAKSELPAGGLSLAALNYQPNGHRQYVASLGIWLSRGQTVAIKLRCKRPLNECYLLLCRP